MIMVVIEDVASTSLLTREEKQLPREETWRGQDTKHSWSGKEVNVIQDLQGTNRRVPVENR